MNPDERRPQFVPSQPNSGTQMFVENYLSE
jgi:hypothetical protein